jgi:hypothetical protein
MIVTYRYWKELVNIRNTVDDSVGPHNVRMILLRMSKLFKRNVW